MICAVLFLIDFEIVGKLWRDSKRDLVTWIGWLIACLTKGVEFGLLVGITINIVFLLSLWARPEIKIEVIEVSDNVTEMKSGQSHR